MEQLFKKVVKVRVENLTNVFAKKNIEKEFIISFFNQLPIEDLKRLINFKLIDPNNKDVWNEKDKEYLYQLEREKCVEYKCELYLDNGIDDLSLGQIS